MTPRRETDINEIYGMHYADNPRLLRLLTVHSECVARKALDCAEKRGLDIDRRFVYEAAMLHDIGIVKCNAPSIFCLGDRPYICHGVEGREMLDALGLPRHALVCERHTGSGLSVNDILTQQLPLPPRDMLPLSFEEKLICYADKFFSKSGDPAAEKPLEKVMRQMQRHGNEALERFISLHRLFG